MGEIEDHASSESSSEDEYEDPVKFGKLASAVMRRGVRSQAVWSRCSWKTQTQLYKEGQKEVYDCIAGSLTMRHKAIIARAAEGDGKAAWQEIKAKYNNQSAGCKTTYLAEFVNASMQQESRSRG